MSHKQIFNTANVAGQLYSGTGHNSDAVQFNIVDSTLAVVDITGMAIRMEFLLTPDATVTIFGPTTGTILSPATDGKFTVDLTTADFSVGRIYVSAYDLVSTDKRILAEGYMNVDLPSVI